MKMLRLTALPIVFTGLLLVFAVTPTQAQTSAQAEVEAVVGQLFDGMRAGDSTAVRAVFHPEARMLSVGYDGQGEPVLRGGDVDGFVEAVGAPRDEVWDEHIADLEVRVDGGLATAWMDYAFYRGEEFSHCGVNAMQFFRSAEGWQIIHITDTRRSDDCERWQ